MSKLQQKINSPSEGYQMSIDMVWQHLNERKKNIDAGTPAEGDSLEKLTTESAAAAVDPYAFRRNMQRGGRRRKSSSRRGRSSTKKRGTQRKQKRRQRRASRRAY